MKKITAILMALTISGLLLFATGNAIAQSANLDIKINEIMFDPVGVDAGNEWIELYNNGTETQNINGWTISNRSGEIAATLPDWDFPGDTYLVVHFGTGTNDNDFSDGNGSFYTGNNIEVFNNTEDECALYGGTPSASTIVDFLSWDVDYSYAGYMAHDCAVSAGMWTSGDYLDIRSHYVSRGETIGRDKDSTDSDISSDWDDHGGKDAMAPTPGAQNLYIIIPPPVLNKPPVAVASANPTNVLVGDTVTFDGSASFDPDGTIVLYEWDFGDGSISIDAITTHEYANAGTYITILKVTDNQDETSFDFVVVTVSAPPLLPPVVVASATPTTVTVGDTVTFDGSTSFDPDGTILSYEWDFGDGSSGTGATTTHTYSKSGKYLAILTVTDNDGLSSSDYVQITVIKRWTIMVYLDGDNSLENNGVKDLNEMEVAGSTDGVSIVVQFDHQTNDSNYRGRYYIEKDKGGLNDKIISHRELIKDEPNMASSEALKTFINWVKSNYTAQHYLLVIWNHGDGWKGVAEDVTTGNDYIFMPELNSALAGENLDIIGFDACLMGMLEVNYQIKDYGDIMVASEETIPGDGWPYHYFLPRLLNDPTMSPTTLATHIVTDYIKFYHDDGNKIKDITLSATDLSKIADLKIEVTNFAGELKEGVEDFMKHYNNKDNIQIEINNSRSQTEKFDTTIGNSSDPKEHTRDYIDLHGFAKQIKNNNGIPDKYKKHANAVFEKVNATVIFHKEGDVFKDSHGISIYFPISQKHYNDPDWSYNKPKPFTIYDQTIGFLFPANTQWDEFLHRYYEPVADAGENKTVCVNKTVTFNGSGSSDSDGSIDKYDWDFGDGSKHGSGKITTHEYTSTGTKIVTLTVTDDDDKTDTDNATITVIHSYVVSSDYSGSEKNVFNTEDNVYCYGGNFPKNKYVDIYVVDEKNDWKDNDVLTDVGDGKNTIRTNDAGKIANTEIWKHPLRIGKYDIVVDVDQDGNYTMCRDAVDSNVEVGFEVIPEFTTIAIPVASIIGLLFLFSRRKRKE